MPSKAKNNISVNGGVAKFKRKVEQKIVRIRKAPTSASVSNSRSRRACGTRRHRRQSATSKNVAIISQILLRQCAKRSTAIVSMIGTLLMILCDGVVLRKRTVQKMIEKYNGKDEQAAESLLRSHLQTIIGVFRIQLVNIATALRLMGIVDTIQLEEEHIPAHPFLLELMGLVDVHKPKVCGPQTESADVTAFLHETESDVDSAVTAVAQNEGVSDLTKYLLDHMRKLG